MTIKLKKPKELKELKEQRTKFESVINYLTSTGESKKNIAVNLGTDNVRISHLLSGALKSIDPQILDGLHKAYNINPLYITHGASNMFDTAGLKYEAFDSFIDDWDLVEHEDDKKYLHLFMNSDFYDFLVTVYDFKENTNSNNKLASAFEEALRIKKAKSKNDKSLNSLIPSLNFTSKNDLYRFVKNVFELYFDSSSFDSKGLESAYNEAFNSIKDNYNYSNHYSSKEYVLLPADDVLEIINENVTRRKQLNEVMNLFNLTPPKKK